MLDQELRARNDVQHARRFNDIAIDHLLLSELRSAIREDDKGWKLEHLAAYRKSASEWAQRVRRSGAVMDKFLEGIADFTLANCGFLSTDVSGHPQPAIDRAGPAAPTGAEK